MLHEFSIKQGQNYVDAMDLVSPCILSAGYSEINVNF